MVCTLWVLALIEVSTELNLASIATRMLLLQDFSMASFVARHDPVPIGWMMLGI